MLSSASFETSDKSRKAIAIWLLVCAATIFAMVVLGGVTRLTGSGLSMVDWNPIMGAIPPLTEQQWEQTFEQYKQFPEYQKVNYTMDLAGFKRIFAFEYAHRVLGRLIGILFFAPFLVFLFKHRIPEPLKLHLWIVFGLGGVQGFMGWYMVASGLVDMPRVSHYRLTAHLGLAVVIYTYMLWLAFGLLYPRAETNDAGSASRGLSRFALALVGLIFVMILSGGLVAGLDAGFTYNTFPLMDGRFFPVGLYNLSPWWMSIFNDITTVQFNHRVLAYLITALVIVFVSMALRRGVRGHLRTGVLLLGVLLLIQVTLGIATLVFVVPVTLGALHQAGAIALLTAALFVTHRLYAATTASHTATTKGVGETTPAGTARELAA